MPLYVADYLADTRALSTVEHGAYLLLIMEYWRNGGLPNDGRKLSRIVGLSEDEWSAIKDNIADLFLPGWKHKRIDAELAEAAKRTEIARSKANKRWGNAPAMPRHCRGNANHNHNHSHLEEREAKASLVGESDKHKSDEIKEGMLFAGEQWNSIASQFKFALITDIKPGSRRERDLLARLRDLKSDFGGMETGFQQLMTRIRGSPFLRGDTGKFRASFDWIINASNFQKIMEGNYEDQKLSVIGRR